MEAVPTDEHGDPRRYPRRELEVEVCVRCGGEVFDAVSETLSYSGALLRFSGEVPPDGGLCQVDIRLARGVVGARGLVVRGADDSRCAVEFEDLHQNGHLLIAALLE